jgi:dsDNA-specific endonuclease/ATPase MutS2
MAKVRRSLSPGRAEEASPPADGQPVEIPIDGVLDLHTFSPREVKDLVPEYIGECVRRGITEIRIIHGKGTGTLKALVYSVLKKDPRVAGFRDAGLDGGGWGATIVRLTGLRSGKRT